MIHALLLATEWTGERGKEPRGGGFGGALQAVLQIGSSSCVSGNTHSATVRRWLRRPFHLVAVRRNMVRKKTKSHSRRAAGNLVH